YILSDALVVWRAWILWPHSRLARGALWVGMTGSVGALLVARYPQARAFGRIAFTPKSLASTLPLVITNLLATTLVGMQLWAYRRDVAASLGPFSGESRVGGILLLLLESGVVFCLM
ncbi:hypothetical protein EV122DRAFT_173218, partial [Schizophyllum commune]